MSPDGEQHRNLRGAGCEQCGGSGYTGRMGIFEMMELNEEIRQLIMANADAAALTQAARRNGMRNLREDGWQKVRMGVTTVGRGDASDPGVLMTPADTHITNYPPTIHVIRGQAFARDYLLLPRHSRGWQTPHRQLTAETDKCVARELRRQGLTPVLCRRGAQEGLQLKVRIRRAAGERDVLFFTQEISTLLNASVPLDRALAITTELTEREYFRTIVLDMLRVLKGGKRWPTAWPPIREYFTDLYVNMVRAGEASGSLAVSVRAPLRVRALARRAAQLHHLGHDLSVSVMRGGTGLGDDPAHVFYH